jgi:hypothetical protein
MKTSDPLEEGDMRKRRLLVIVCFLWVLPLIHISAFPEQEPATVNAKPTLTIDLSQIGPTAPKGRVQDKEYNPHLPVVDALIEAGPDAIPFLVSKLEDETEIEGHVFDYWPRVYVGDAAFRILRDFFTTPDWQHSTVSGFCGNELIERDNYRIAFSSAFAEYIAAHGRRELRRKIENLLRPYDGQFAWDPQMRCFVPKKGGPHVAGEPVKTWKCEMWKWPKEIRVKEIYALPPRYQNDPPVIEAIVEVDKMEQ